MNAVASVTAAIRSGTPCADDAWRAGTRYDQERFRITRYSCDAYSAAQIDVRIMSGRYGVGVSRHRHLAGIGLPFMALKEDRENVEGGVAR
jgi:hypothetical protein